MPWPSALIEHVRHLRKEQRDPAEREALRILRLASPRGAQILTTVADQLRDNELVAAFLAEAGGEIGRSVWMRTHSEDAARLFDVAESILNTGDIRGNKRLFDAFDIPCDDAPPFIWNDSIKKDLESQLTSAMRLAEPCEVIHVQMTLVADLVFDGESAETPLSIMLAEPGRCSLQGEKDARLRQAGTQLLEALGVLKPLHPGSGVDDPKLVVQVARLLEYATSTMDGFALAQLGIDIDRFEDEGIITEGDRIIEKGVELADGEQTSVKLERCADGTQVRYRDPLAGADVVLPAKHARRWKVQLFPVERHRIANLMIERIDLVHAGEVQGIKVKWREVGWNALIEEVAPDSVGAELLEVEA